MRAGPIASTTTTPGCPPRAPAAAGSGSIECPPTGRAGAELRWHMAPPIQYPIRHAHRAVPGSAPAVTVLTGVPGPGRRCGVSGADRPRRCGCCAHRVVRSANRRAGPGSPVRRLPSRQVALLLIQRATMCAVFVLRLLRSNSFLLCAHVSYSVVGATMIVSQMLIRLLHRARGTCPDTTQSLLFSYLNEMVASLIESIVATKQKLPDRRC
jgi:hypothetical protein